MKVLHIITSLNTGGAEMMLYKLLLYKKMPEYKPVVVSLLDKGSIGSELDKLKIKVYSLNMKRSYPTVSDLFKIRKIIKSEEWDIVQGWMYHGNIASIIATMFLKKRIPIIWNIRHSLEQLSTEKCLTRFVIWLSAYLSKSNNVKKIIYNSKLSSIQHENYGYDNQKTLVIPNGFDIETYKPNNEARREIRAELEFDNKTILIGMVARYHPLKDHLNLLKAASYCLKKDSSIHFILVGKEVSFDNKEIVKVLNDLGIESNVHLLGERKDIPKIMNSIDILCSSSKGEGFPNVIGEGMSCGIPCVATDVGESKYIIMGVGELVPPCDPKAFSKSILKLVSMTTRDRKNLGEKARKRVEEKFSLEKIVIKYEELYKMTLCTS